MTHLHDSTRGPRRAAVRRVAATVAAVWCVSACASGEALPAAADVAPTPTVAATTVAPTTVAPTTAAPTTMAPTTLAPTTVPPTTESCGAFCPLTDEQQAATDAFFEAYNGDDWTTFAELLATDEPTWVMTPTITQTSEQIRYDFIWSDAMNEVWTPERCVNQYGLVSCLVSMEDDLHRLLAPYEMEPSRCQLSFEVTDGKVLPKRYDALSGCHLYYDGAMHFFGAWFSDAYPDQPPIHGVHYRGWNQTDETAGRRAADHLDEWAPLMQEAMEGMTVFDVSGHP